LSGLQQQRNRWQMEDARQQQHIRCLSNHSSAVDWLFMPVMPKWQPVLDAEEGAPATYVADLQFSCSTEARIRQQAHLIRLCRFLQQNPSCNSACTGMRAAHQ
jgi:hypothetical protein